MMSAAEALLPDKAVLLDHIAVMDPHRFDRLLQMAGPDVAGDLFDRLTEDLQGVAQGLAKALPAQDKPAHDWVALRSQSHVLIALAGAVGALRLQAAAEAINRCAHATDAQGSAALAAPVLAMLDALLADIDRRAQNWRGKA